MLEEGRGTGQQRAVYPRVTAEACTAAGEPQTPAGRNEYQDATRTVHGKDVKTKVEVTTRGG